MQASYERTTSTLSQESFGRARAERYDGDTKRDKLKSTQRVFFFICVFLASETNELDERRALCLSRWEWSEKESEKSEEK